MENFELVAGDTGHSHTAMLGPSGSGTSTEADGHTHAIEENKVAEAGGHTHTLKAKDEDESPKDDAPAEETSE